MDRHCLLVMGQIILAHLLLKIIFVNASIRGGWNQTTDTLQASSASQVEKDMNLLCEKLEEEQFDKVEDQFKKEQQKRKVEEKTSVMLPAKPLLVNALVVVDQALDNMIGNSSQVVEDFFPLVNHILGSVGIKIRISDVLIETSSRNFNFLEPFKGFGHKFWDSEFVAEVARL